MCAICTNYTLCPVYVNCFFMFLILMGALRNLLPFPAAAAVPGIPCASEIRAALGGALETALVRRARTRNAPKGVYRKPAYELLAITEQLTRPEFGRHP